MSLTDNAKLARFIEQHTRIHGQPPSQAEVADHLGMSPSGARRRLVKAADAGAISWDSTRRRSMRKTDMKHRGIETL